MKYSILKIFCFSLPVTTTFLSAQETFAIRTDVNLVQLHARVTDRQGHTVLGLEKNAFQLLVDGAPQPIGLFQGEDAPVTAGIVIDNSASMAPKQKEVIAAALAFAQASNPKDQIFVVHFNSRPRLALPSGTPFTGDVTELDKAVSAFELGGTTAFYDALLMAEHQFQTAAYSRKVLLTITDGGDNSSRATLNEALDSLRHSGIAVYTVGLFDEADKDRNPDVLSKIATSTGGEAFLPEHIQDVTSTCVKVAEEIRRQYTIGFHAAEDGQYHRIRLTALDTKHGPLAVETRAGYFASAFAKGPTPY